MESIESTAYHGFPWIPRNFHGFGWNSMDSVKLNGLGNPRIPWSFTASSVFLECYLIHRIRRNRDSARALDSTRAFRILEIMALWKSEDSMDPFESYGIPWNSSQHGNSKKLLEFYGIPTHRNHRMLEICEFHKKTLDSIHSGIPRFDGFHGVPWHSLIPRRSMEPMEW